MKKLLQILENYVQWATLVLGLAWVAYIVMTYVVGVPAVTIPPDTTPLTAGKVDDYIDQNQREKLENAIDDQTPVNWPPLVPPLTLTKVFQRKPAPDEPILYMNAPAQEPLQGGGAVAGNQQAGPVKDVPTLPAVILDVPRTGRANVNIPGMPNPNPDVDWVAVTGTIPMAPIAKEWIAKYGNTNLTAQTTYILQTTLYRREKNPIDGTWKEVSNPLLPNQQPIDSLPTYPGNNPEDEREYLGAVQALAQAITNPHFYHVNLGDPWPWPGNVQGGAGGGAVPPPQPAGGQPVAPAAGAAATPAVPGGAFLPPTTASDIPIVLHDESAQSGHVYQYRIGYKLYNPAFDQTPAVAVAAVSAKFELVEKDLGPWSKDVTIDPRTFVFLKTVKIINGNVTAIFDVFTWTKGKQLWQQIPVQVGDEIGKGDFATGFTLVDANNSNQAALVANDSDGTVASHDAGTDGKSVKYMQLQNQAGSPTPTN